MRRFLFLWFMVALSTLTYAQPQWSTLPNAPERPNSRMDDIYFINPDTGWAAVRQDTAYVYKTTDGGNTWVGYRISSLLALPRSIRFTDAQTGWLGVLSSSAPFWRSTNGGTTWAQVTLPTSINGVCGLFSLGTTHVFGCGTYSSATAPYFFKTTDGGQTWTVKNMSAIAGGLVDVYFFSPDVGILVGNGVEGTDFGTKKGIVLRTSDGGITWQKIFETPTPGYIGWKIIFPTPTIGYVSLEPLATGQTLNPRYLKTTDGGVTWDMRALPDNTVNIQGIAFLSDGLRGWAGGLTMTYETQDGGDTWVPSFGKNLNRFRMFNDTLGYAIGEAVYKFSNQQSPTSVETYQPVPRFVELDQNYPNPFNPSTTIEFILHQDAFVTLTIHDVLGNEIAVLLNQPLNQALYRKYWDATGFPSGTYFYRLVTPQFTQTRKMVLVK